MDQLCPLVSFSPVILRANFARVERNLTDEYGCWMRNRAGGNYSNLKLQLDRKQRDWFYLHKNDEIDASMVEE